MSTQSKDCNQFIIHVAMGDESQIDRILRKNPECSNAVDLKGNPVLFYAKDPAIAQKLVVSGADVNAQDAFGNTALHVIAASGLAVGGRTEQKMKVAKALLELGADPAKTNKQGATVENILEAACKSLGIPPNNFHSELMAATRLNGLEESSIASKLDRKASESTGPSSKVSVSM